MSDDDVDKETALRSTICELRRKLQDAELELEGLRRGQGIFGRLRHGDRVRLVRDYGPNSSAPMGSVGRVDYLWNDGQAAVQFDDGSRAAYWPRDLEHEATPSESGARCVDRKACDRRRTSLAPGPAPGNASKGDE